MWIHFRTASCQRRYYGKVLQRYARVILLHNIVPIRWVRKGGGYGMTCVIDQIEELMQSDDDDREEQSELLVSIYDEADENGKKLIDRVIICLCGYSLKTLMKS